jgi:hypothetical protein
MRTGYLHRAPTKCGRSARPPNPLVVYYFGPSHVGTRGILGSRLAEHLGILTRGSRLLRGLRKGASARSVNPRRVPGIDDRAWRKGRRYGTILCDLEQRKVIDLLPYWSAESTSAWIREHPGIEIGSRDRASLYAEAADAAAPHAVQVADRWHLLRNLGDALVGVLVTRHGVMAEAARAA